MTAVDDGHSQWVAIPDEPQHAVPKLDVMLALMGGGRPGEHGVEDRFGIGRCDRQRQVPHRWRVAAKRLLFRIFDTPALLLDD